MGYAQTPQLVCKSQFVICIARFLAIRPIVAVVISRPVPLLWQQPNITSIVQGGGHHIQDANKKRMHGRKFRKAKVHVTTPCLTCAGKETGNIRLDGIAFCQ